MMPRRQCTPGGRRCLGWGPGMYAVRFVQPAPVLTEAVCCGRGCVLWLLPGSGWPEREGACVYSVRSEFRPPAF